MAAIGIWLVADLDRGEIRSERAVGGSHLARGGGRFVVGHADCQQDLPAAAAGEHAERMHLFGSDRARCPRRPWGGGVGPGDVLVRGDAAEAQHAGPQRPQQPDQVAALCVPRELAERGHLEGKPEKPLVHRRAWSERVDRHSHRERGLRRRDAFGRGGEQGGG